MSIISFCSGLRKCPSPPCGHDMKDVADCLAQALEAKSKLGPEKRKIGGNGHPEVLQDGEAWFNASSSQDANNDLNIKPPQMIEGRKNPPHFD